MIIRSLKPLLGVLYAGLMALAGIASAGPLDLRLELPLIAFDSTGTTTYDADTGTFLVVAEPTDILLSSPPPVRIGSPRAFLIELSVNPDGSLVGGYLQVSGTVDLGGGDIRSGVLLEGSALDFAAQGSDAAFAAFDFVFELDGGALGDLYADARLGVEMGSEDSDFVDFSSDFSGGAKGNLGALPAPPADCSLAVDYQCLVVAPASGDLACDSRVAATRLRYTGPTILSASVEIEGDSGATAFYGSIDLVSGVTVLDADGGFSIDAALDNESDLGSKMRIFINGSEEVHHTSCSVTYAAGGPAPLDNPKGQPSDLWFVEAFRDKEGDLIEPPQAEFSDRCDIPPLTGGECERRPGEIRFRYTGGDCDASVQAQDDDKFSCVDFAAAGEPVRVLITKDGDDDAVNLDQSGVHLGDLLSASAPAGRDDFDSQTLATIFDASGNTVQAVSFHTSCSQPLRLGDRFGALEVVGFTNDEQGTVQSGTEVILSYTVSNTGTTDVFGISVEDTRLDPAAVPGSPLALVAGDTQALMTSIFASEASDGTVTVSGATTDGAVCEASDELAIGIQQAPPCEVDGDGSLKLEDKKIQWKLFNTGDQPATIASIDIAWPAEHGDLKKIRLEGDEIFATPLPPASASIDSFTGDADERRIAPGDDARLMFEFSEKFSDSTEADFQITVHFAEGCSVSFEPGTSGGGVECTGEIRATLLQYTGPDISGATVEFVGKDASATYDNVDLTAGTVLQTGDYTLDVRPGSMGSRMSIFIDGIEEVHHTSCSAPYVVDAPAPLNDPKGDPSPDWFVLGFVDKNGVVAP